MSEPEYQSLDTTGIERMLESSDEEEEEEQEDGPNPLMASGMFKDNE